MIDGWSLVSQWELGMLFLKATKKNTVDTGGIQTYWATGDSQAFDYPYNIQSIHRNTNAETLGIGVNADNYDPIDSSIAKSVYAMLALMTIGDTLCHQ